MIKTDHCDYLAFDSSSYPDSGVGGMGGWSGITLTYLLRFNQVWSFESIAVVWPGSCSSTRRYLRLCGESWAPLHSAQDDLRGDISAKCPKSLLCVKIGERNEMWLECLTCHQAQDRYRDKTWWDGRIEYCVSLQNCTNISVWGIRTKLTFLVV